MLGDLPKLKELTLNDSSVTDAGLAKLAQLPRLESLRIARTQVTADGVRAFLAAPPPRRRQRSKSRTARFGSRATASAARSRFSPPGS
jgi:hypothetical protein